MRIYLENDIELELQGILKLQSGVWYEVTEEHQLSTLAERYLVLHWQLGLLAQSSDPKKKNVSNLQMSSSSEYLPL